MLCIQEKMDAAHLSRCFANDVTLNNYSRSVKLYWQSETKWVTSNRIEVWKEHMSENKDTLRKGIRSVVVRMRRSRVRVQVLLPLDFLSLRASTAHYLVMGSIFYNERTMAGDRQCTEKNPDANDHKCWRALKKTKKRRKVYCRNLVGGQEKEHRRWAYKTGYVQILQNLVLCITGLCLLFRITP